MKMKKGFLSLAVILCMLFCLAAVPVSAANTVSRGKCGESLSWALDSYGTLTISGTGDMYDYRDMTDGYDGDPSGIFPPWYESLSSIKTIVIESGASSIGDFAFEMFLLYMPDEF